MQDVFAQLPSVRSRKIRVVSHCCSPSLGFIQSHRRILLVCPTMPALPLHGLRSAARCPDRNKRLPSPQLCTHLASPPSLYCCSPSLMGDSANAPTVRTAGRWASSPLSTRRDQILLPPAVAESASSHCSTLHSASVSAMTGLCKCLVLNSLRTASLLMISCSLVGS